MKTITKYNVTTAKNSVSGPNGDLLESRLNLMLNYCVSGFMLVK